MQPKCFAFIKKTLALLLDSQDNKLDDKKFSKKLKVIRNTVLTTIRYMKPWLKKPSLKW